MTTFSRRYASGEHEAVWNDLRSLGPVPGRLREDVADVARQTMVRVAAHLRRLAEDAPAAGLKPLHDCGPTPPAPDERAVIERMDREVGGLPAALVACVYETGRFSLIGDWPVLGLHHDDWTDVPDGAGVLFCDPLDLPGAAGPDNEWRDHWDEWRDHWGEWKDDWREGLDDRADGRERGRPFRLPFAPDEVLKTGYGGLSHNIEIPGTGADPVLWGVMYRPGITLVEYLRVSVAWGGFPGWEFVEGPVPEALSGLRRDPDF